MVTCPHEVISSLCFISEANSDSQKKRSTSPRDTGYIDLKRGYMGQLALKSSLNFGILCVKCQMSLLGLVLNSLFEIQNGGLWFEYPECHKLHEDIINACRSHLKTISGIENF